MNKNATATPEHKPVRPVWWVGSTYFMQGLPYMIVRALSFVFFTDIGVKERYLGYLNFLGIPWIFKFVWSPLVDIFFTKRGWMIASQLILSLLTGAVAALNLFIPPADPTPWLLAASVLFVVMGFVAATNDIAIDGYYMEGLTDKGEQAAWSGHRVLAWRLSVPYVRSLLVAVAAWVVAIQASGDRFLPWVRSVGAAVRGVLAPGAAAGIPVRGTGDIYLPWFWAFGAGALTLFVFTIYHVLKLPRFEARKEKTGISTRESLRKFGEAFLSFLKQKRVSLIIAFIILYKVGDEIIFCMVTPFLMREIGLTKFQLSWISGIVGTVGAIGGAMLSGWCIKKWGLGRAIWPLTLAMNLNIWAYIWLAWVKPDPSTGGGEFLVAFVHFYEQLAAGLGDTVLIVYIMRTCRAEYKATHYAVGSAIKSLVAIGVGGFGGQMVEAMGYVNFYIIGFATTIPAMVLLFWVPLLQDEPKA